MTRHQWQALQAAAMTPSAAAQAFPSWQVLLVDLRCHGESARLPTRPDGPHNLNSAAGDVLRLLGRLKLFPEVLIGHSFGGKAWPL